MKCTSFSKHKLIKHDSLIDTGNNNFICPWTVPLLNVGERESRLSRDGVLSRKTLLLLTSTNNLTSLATLLNGNNLNLLVASRALQATNKLRKNIELVEGKLAVEDSIRGLTALNQATLKTLDEGHSLLHLTELADLAVKFLIVDGDVERIEGIANKIDVLLLPDRVLLSGIDGNLLGLTGVESNVLALGQTLGEVGLGRKNC